MQPPSVTVLLPVYNCETYIAEAMESVLAQTFTDFELLIIDDASTDRTVDVIKSYSDSRIVFLQKPKNTGYTRSLNMGLQMARGKFIARMDGDDVCRPNRLERQVNVLQSRPELLLVGSLFSIIGGLKPRYSPLTHELIKVYLLHHNYIQHPTVMMRREVITQFNLQYNPAYEPTEDYKLWSEIVRCGKVEVINEILLDYRMHVAQTSTVRMIEQEEQANRVRLEMVSLLVCNKEMDERKRKFHLQLIKNEVDKDFSLRKMDSWIKQLIAANVEKREFDHKELQQFLLDKQHNIVKNYYQHMSRHSLNNMAYYVQNFKKLRSDIFSINYFELALRILFRNCFKRFFD